MEQRLNLMWIPSLPKLWRTPSPPVSLFPLEICLRLCVLCCTSLNVPPSTIYFPLLYPQNVLLVCGKPPSPTLLTCCLLSFGCCFVIVLPHSYIPSYSPPCHIFSIISTEALWPCITTEKQYFFFPISISGLGRNSVQNNALLLLSSWSSHTV